MRRDVLSAYAASGAKVLSWVVVSALVFRANLMHYAVLALVRGTLGLLNYTTLGLAPAMVRVAAATNAGARPTPPAPADSPSSSSRDAAAPVLGYRRVESADPANQPLRDVYASALLIAGISAAVGLSLTITYAIGFHWVHEVPVQVGRSALEWVVICMGAGTILRLLSEAPGAVVQMRERIARDNLFVTLSELSWPVLTPLCTMFGAMLGGASAGMLQGAAFGYAASGALLLVLRLAEAERHTRLLSRNTRMNIDAATVKQLLAIGSLVAVAQLADFLYAPTDYILINRLISPGTVARYAPAVQIDAGLLLLVGALSAVLLPKAALAHAAGDHAALRRYYVRGTLASAGLLVAAGVAVYSLSPAIFQVWLGDDLPLTRAILPLVLVHTVVGGSSGVGRSILLGMGKVKPFAIAALVAGAANVVLSYAFVRYLHLGLHGIVLGTIVAVCGRCVVWQPWYVMRTLRREAEAARPIDERVAAIPETPL